MQDFGESLIDVRDRLSIPLPMRVQRTRLFVLSFMESLCMAPIRLFDPKYQRVVDRLPSPWDDDGVKDVHDAFGELKKLEPTADQIDQAKDVFMQEVSRRMVRLNVEITLCLRIIRASMFIGVALYLNVLVAIGLLELHDHFRLAAEMFIGLAIVQFIGAFICLNGFVRCNLLR